MKTNLAVPEASVTLEMRTIKIGIKNTGSAWLMRIGKVKWSPFSNISSIYEGEQRRCTYSLKQPRSCWNIEDVNQNQSECEKSPREAPVVPPEKQKFFRRYLDNMDQMGSVKLATATHCVASPLIVPKNHQLCFGYWLNIVLLTKKRRR